MSTLERGAENVIKLLHVVPQDRVVIVTDEATHEIGQALFMEANQITDTLLILIEDYTPRPATTLPAELQAEILHFVPNVSIYAATALEGELPQFRSPLRDLLNKELQCRHAHMPGVTMPLMLEGMNTDYEQVAQLSKKLYEIIQEHNILKITSEDGTDLEVSYDPMRYKWIISDGNLQEPGAWSNLPDGEVFSTPVRVNGVIAGRVVGDYFSERYGVLPEPLMVEINDSIVTGITGTNQQLVTELHEYLHAAENNNRVGEVAIGTNVGLSALTGNLLQDEKFPGFHLAFGHPYPDLTGAEWDAPGHVDIVSPQTSIWIGEKQIMDHGKFLID